MNQAKSYNQNYHKGYNQNYYKAHKQELLEKVECSVCNKNIGKCNFAKHLQTPKHLENKLKAESAEENFETLLKVLVKLQKLT